MHSPTRIAFLAPLAALLLLAGQAAAGELKIAVLSMEKAFDEFHKTKTENAKLKTKADDIEKKRDAMLADAKRLKNELELLSREARDKSLSEAEQDKKKRLAETQYTNLRDAEEKLMDFDKTYKRQFSEQMRDMQKKLVDEIRAVVEKYAQSKGITLVLDASGKTLNNVESVVYSEAAMDITGDIIVILNKDRKDADQ